MNKIKAIAFDLGGVLIKEKDINLSPLEEILEKQFGNLNTKKSFFDWAIKETNLSKEEIENSVKRIISIIYQIKEPDLFQKIPKFRFFIATNHLSYVNNWIYSQNFFDNIEAVINSDNIGFQKPDKNFYNYLISKVKEKPESILFIDDNSSNINGAKNCGLQTLFFERNKFLSEEINHYLNSNDKCF